MCKIKNIIISVVLFFVNFLSFGQDTIINTKYPVILVHGIGYRDFLPFKKYWGNIPRYLKKNGATVYVSNADALGSIEGNAVQLKKYILDLIEENGYEKVNIIAHSKGGLDSRYMISNLQMSDYVASLTTVSTPHRGSVWADLAISAVDYYGMLGFAEKCSYLWADILNDKQPEPMKAYYELTTYEMAELNNLMPDADSVYYQSYGSYIKKEYPRISLKYKEKLISEEYGKNDGVVPAISFRWTNFKGYAGEDSDFGISHYEIIGFTNVTSFDENLFYKQIIIDLKSNGF